MIISFDGFKKANMYKPQMIIIIPKIPCIFTLFILFERLSTLRLQIVRLV